MPILNSNAIKKYIFYFYYFFCFSAWKSEGSIVWRFKEKYFNIEENNEAALGSVNDFIKSKRKNNEQLVLGYEDGVYYSASSEKKLMYADSSIATAKKTLNNDLISRSYLEKELYTIII